ncbi:MAG: hypothetical protein ABSA44_08845 [Bacteroidota bacterium]
MKKKLLSTKTSKRNVNLHPAHTVSLSAWLGRIEKSIDPIFKINTNKHKIEIFMNGKIEGFTEKTLPILYMENRIRSYFSALRAIHFCHRQENKFLRLQLAAHIPQKKDKAL